VHGTQEVPFLKKPFSQSSTHFPLTRIFGSLQVVQLSVELQLPQLVLHGAQVEPVGVTTLVVPSGQTGTHSPWFKIRGGLQVTHCPDDLHLAQPSVQFSHLPSMGICPNGHWITQCPSEVKTLPAVQFVQFSGPVHSAQPLHSIHKLFCL